MTQRLYLIGGGGHCKQCIEIAELMGYTDITVIDDYRTEPVLGRPVIRMPDVVDGHAFITIGDNRVRKQIYERRPDLNYVNLIHPRSSVSKYSRMGVGNYIGCHAVLLQDSVIGSFNILNDVSCVTHDCRIGDFNHVSIHGAMLGRTSIGNGNLVCGHGVIIPDVRMGDWNVLGAGSTLLKSCGDGLTLVGSPAITKPSQGNATRNVLGSH
jgi:sugar O-acyltransferase (sialic acid O-acetyltransferase NeuD family)